MNQPMNRPTLRRGQPLPEDSVDLLHHPATVPATIWAALLLAACLSTLFDQPQSQSTSTAAAASAVAESAVPPRP